MSKLTYLLLVFVFSLFGCSTSLTQSTMNKDGQVYESPEEAVAALKAAFASEDPNRLVGIYGTIGRDIIVSGDPIADAIMMRKMAFKFDQRAELLPVDSADHPNEQWYKIKFSREGWVMRIPLVNRGQGWLFATEYAKDAAEETRREINEVMAVDNLYLLVSAQAQYIKTDQDGDGVLEYAQKIISTPGKRDGLYWEPKPGLPKSPLNEVVAKAIQAGYDASKRSSYYGYMYQILPGQGQHAPGGSRKYIKNGKMTGGFAVLAYPVNWNVSGAKTFVVNAEGRMFKKDLGFKTESIASDMKEINPDRTWVKVEHPELGLRL